MADSLYYKHGTSDECIDPYCDICFETKGHNIKVYGYCKECFQFLCTDCHVFHKQFKGTRNHTILQGMDMPQSQAEKPARFEICDLHSKQVKDQFCSKHNILLCLSCSSSVHKDCPVLSVEDTCKNINSSEIHELYGDLKKLKHALDRTGSSIIATIDALKEKKENILKDARDVYDKIITKANELFKKLKTSVEEKFKSELSVLQTYQKQIQDTVATLDSSLSEIAKLKGKVIDSKAFLKVHDIVSFTKKGNALSGNIHTATLSMEPNQIIKDFLSSSTVLGSVTRTEIKSRAGVISPDIKFPAVATKAKTSKPPLPLSAIKAAKSNTSNIKLADDKKSCWITGMVIMNNGTRVLADHSNSRLKMFRPDMKVLACLILQDESWDISIVSDSEVVVSTDTNTLVMVSISNTQMSITKSRKLSFEVSGIAKFKYKFVVTCMNPSPASVKLIDLAGNVYWSLAQDQHGQPLFNYLQYLCHHTDGTSSTAAVTDYWDNSLTLVNGETGEVITRRRVKEKGLLGVITDNRGNIYVCYNKTHEVAVLNRDLSEERILLTKRNGIGDYPQAIAYDDTAHQLIVSYSGSSSCNSLDCYQLK